MSGITAAQYIRNVHGIVVSHDAKYPEKVFERVVRVHGTVVKRGKDDALATGTAEWTAKVMNLFKDELLGAKLRPAPTGYSLSISNAVAVVDLSKVDSLLDKLYDHVKIKQIAESYCRICKIEVNDPESDRRRTNLLFDVLARLFITIRSEGLKVSNDQVPEDAPRLSQVVSKLGDCRSAVVDIEALVPAFLAVHPTAKQVERNGQKYLLADGEMDPLWIVHGEQAAFDLVLDQLKMPEINGQSGGEIEVGGEDLEQIIVRVIRGAYQKLSPVDQAWVSSEQQLKTDLGLSETKLRHLGKIAGTGLLKECVLRVKDHLYAGGHQDEAALKLAAIRVAKMQSNKCVDAVNGTFMLRDK